MLESRLIFIKLYAMLTPEHPVLSIGVAALKKMDCIAAGFAARGGGGGAVQ